MSDQTPKPGFLTTEFLVTLTNQTAGLFCIMLAVFGPISVGESLRELLVVSGLSLMGVQGIGYGISRAIIKRAAQPKIIYMEKPNDQQI